VKRLKAFDNLVEALESLPTIGKKTALRLAYSMAVEDGFGAMKLSHAIENAVNTIRTCSRCHNMSEDELCYICSDGTRDSSKICIVQSAKDIISIEESGEFGGLYYIINKLEYLDNIHLRKMIKDVDEIIFAFPPSIATDTMILYIEDKLIDTDIKFTKIAQGVPTGIGLDNIDSISLSRAFENRIRV